jgi:acetoacetyl-CoA synthetase
MSEAAPVQVWSPSPADVEDSNLTAYTEWLRQKRGLEVDGYEKLWSWSTERPDDFWTSLIEYFGVITEGEAEAVTDGAPMPGTRWFEGLSLNYAEHVFRDRDPGAVAIVATSEGGPAREITWAELESSVSAAAEGLRALGVSEGDRVAAYLPNVPEAVVGFLACAAIGAIWSSCSPDFGAGAVRDRFAQIEPRVLIAVDGYHYGGRFFDRTGIVSDLVASMPSVEHTVLVSSGAREVGEVPGALRWDAALGSGSGEPLSFARVPFSQPLWILYSSGTTGLPKAIVQGQGGILLEHLKVMHLHLDARPGDRIFWFTTTGWMMWNFLVSCLLTGSTIVLYDGNPGYPNLEVLWDMAEDVGFTCFGTSASYLSACMKEGLEPARNRDLSRLRSIGSTGSPLSPEGFDWVYREVGDDIWLFSTSGGTDLCTAFVGGVPTLPVFRGELQARALGAAIESWSEEGEPLTGAVGELVITRPMPSMPLFLWGDEDGSRYRESYFDTYPGVWRHGDWIELTGRGTAVIYGRSDSTINRGGIRMGTSEIYRAVLTVEGIRDALVVDIPREGTEGWMPLFVVLEEGTELDDDLRSAVAVEVRGRCSPRHVPDVLVEVEEVPRTLSGKILEVPVKRILTGTPVERAASRDSLANPDSLDFFVEYAADLDRGA